METDLFDFDILTPFNLLRDGTCLHSPLFLFAWFFSTDFDTLIEVKNFGELSLPG